MRFHIAGLFDKSDGNPMDKSWKLMNKAVYDRSLMNVLRAKWNLAPDSCAMINISNIQCRFIQAVDNNMPPKQIVTKMHDEDSDTNMTIRSDIAEMGMSAKKSPRDEIQRIQMVYV